MASRAPKRSAFDRAPSRVSVAVSSASSGRMTGARMAIRAAFAGGDGGTGAVAFGVEAVLAGEFGVGAEPGGYCRAVPGRRVGVDVVAVLGQVAELGRLNSGGGGGVGWAIALSTEKVVSEY
jgi:hypothetical protein